MVGGPLLFSEGPSSPPSLPLPRLSWTVAPSWVAQFWVLSMVVLLTTNRQRCSSVLASSVQQGEGYDKVTANHYLSSRAYLVGPSPSQLSPQSSLLRPLMVAPARNSEIPRLSQLILHQAFHPPQMRLQYKPSSWTYMHPFHDLTFLPGMLGGPFLGTLPGGPFFVPLRQYCVKKCQYATQSEW
eukprot:COSAG05_NODE_2090_length_3582_cov_5.475452_4_plen_184_part_00